MYAVLFKFDYTKLDFLRTTCHLLTSFPIMSRPWLWLQVLGRHL